MSSNKMMLVALVVCTSAAAQQSPQVLPVPIQQQIVPSISEVQPALKPWPADKKLSIGELSALQESKEREALLSRLGYTTAKPSPPPSTTTSTRPVRATAAVAARTTVVLNGVFGPARDPRAEVSVDGITRAVRAGETISGITVIGISKNGVALKKGAHPAKTVAVGQYAAL
jgi:hypothetical protein